MTEGLSRGEEEIIESALRRAALNDYPNPDGKGCPEDKNTLKRLAAKKLKPTDPVVQHVAECSPCFREMQEFRRKLKGHPWLKIFASALAILGVTAAIFMSKPSFHSRRKE
ncbi:MAG: hypothetical protein ACR2JB_13280 [Bryobacteraceae bacterium]